MRSHQGQNRRLLRRQMSNMGRLNGRLVSVARQRDRLFLRYCMHTLTAVRRTEYRVLEY